MTTLQQQHSAIWESYIRKECQALHKAGRALVDKNWEAPRVPGKQIPREASKPDFSGVYPYGRHVVFEAKATLSKTRFDFNQISEGQWDHLSLAHRWGASAFVYVLDGRRRKWVLPWRVIEATDRRSFPFNEDMKHFQKKRGETWLDTWGRLMDEGEI